MKENFDKTGIPQKIKPVKIEISTEYDKKKIEFRNLVAPIIKKHGIQFVLDYVEKNSNGGIAGIVTERLIGGEMPSMSIYRDIFATLEALKISDPELNQKEILPEIKNKEKEVPKPPTRKTRGPNKNPKQIEEENNRKMQTLIDKLKANGKVVKFEE